MRQGTHRDTRTPSRRTFITTVGRGAVAGLLSARAIASGPLHAQTSTSIAAPLTKAIPRTNESLPAIGLGTFLTFDIVPGQKRDHIGEVVRRFWAAGGRVVDTSPLYGMAEVSLGDFASTLGINSQLFVTNKIWSTGEYLADDSHGERSLRLSMERLWRDRAVVLRMNGSRVAAASIVLGWVAPTPRRAEGSERMLLGQTVTAALARRAAKTAVAGATPLTNNAYKVPVLETVIRRTILAAASA